MKPLLSAFVLVWLLLSACGGSGGSGSVSAAGVSVRVPEGWKSLTTKTGLTIAFDAADLKSEAPSYPRVKVETSTASDPTLEQVLKAVPGSQIKARAERISVVEDPAEATVGGMKAVTIAVKADIGDQSITTRHVIVAIGGASAVSFQLEAPSDQWEAQKEVLASILSSVSFDPKKLPPPGVNPASQR